MSSQVSCSRLAAFYGHLDAPMLLHAMITQEFKGRIALLTSFGADAALMVALVAEVSPATPVLFLETEKHFPETLDYAKKLSERFQLGNVHYLSPDQGLMQKHDPDGTLWQKQPGRCCWLRKVEPLSRAVKQLGVEALITGRKRYQTQERAEMETIELDVDGLFRINPLAHWSRERIKEEFEKRALPKHPLLEKGYRSIGCEPCTAPVSENTDERAGRWAHTIGLDEKQKTECGIHLPGMVEWSV